MNVTFSAPAWLAAAEGEDAGWDAGGAADAAADALGDGVAPELQAPTTTAADANSAAVRPKRSVINAIPPLS
jgi:hypothetical protein